MEEEKKRKENGRGEGKGRGKIFCTFSSLEAFNEDRLTRSLTKELVVEREKVIIITIIAVQSLCFSFFCCGTVHTTQFLMPFVYYEVSFRIWGKF